MDKLYDTPLKSIIKKCLDGSYWQPKEVRKCVIVDCLIYPYRFGPRPNESIIDKLEQFYKEKVEPSEGF